MPRKRHNKAIRVKLPVIFEAKGIRFKTTQVFGPEALEYMRRKLLEEAKELARAIAEHHTGTDKRLIVDEMVDLEEVLVTLRQMFGIKKREVAQRQTVKKLERGGFRKNGMVIVLHWTEESNTTTK